MAALAPWPARWTRAECSDFRRSQDVRSFVHRRFREHWPSRYFLPGIAGFEQGEHSGDFEQAEHRATESLQAKYRLVVASYSKSFDQGSDSRCLNVWNTC